MPEHRQRLTNMMGTSRIKKLLWPVSQSQELFNIKQKRPWQRYTLCQGRISTIIRGATLIHSMTCALSGIPSYPRQLTCALTSQNTLWKATFDCALSGPFDNLFLVWFSASQTLCKGMIAVIYTSTVWIIYLFTILALDRSFVNRANLFFTKK